MTNRQAFGRLVYPYPSVSFVELPPHRHRQLFTFMSVSCMCVCASVCGWMDGIYIYSNPHTHIEIHKMYINIFVGYVYITEFQNEAYILNSFRTVGRRSFAHHRQPSSSSSEKLCERTSRTKRTTNIFIRVVCMNCRWKNGK